MVKHPLRYWFWRIYAPVVWGGFGLPAVLWLTTMNLEYLRFCLFAMPFYIPAVIAMCNPWIFPFDYSVFGRYRRRPLPKEAPLRRLGENWDMFRSGGAAGRGGMGSVVWLLYRHGIGIKTFYGSAFVRLDEIEALDLDHGFNDTLYRNTSTLYHHCPEIRDPITVPKWAAKIMAAYYPEKVLVEAEAV